MNSKYDGPAPDEAMIAKATAALKTMALPTRITMRMDALGLNPLSAAKKAGLGDDFVRDILRGKVKRPSAERLAKLAEALQCSVAYLLGLPEQEPRGAPQKFERPGPPAEAPALAGSGSPMFYLPIRYELFTDAYRRSPEIPRDLGFEAASLVPAYRDREQWFEVVGDAGADLLAPRGSLLQVAKYTDDERDALSEGDFVVIEKHLIAPDVSYYLVERSVRQIHRRYPDSGLWFFEYATSDENYWGISDDLFRNENPSNVEVMSEEEIAESFRDLGPVTLRKGGEPDFKINTPVEMARYLNQQQKQRPQVMGKVLRALIPIDPRSDFGLAPGNSGRVPK